MIGKKRRKRLRRKCHKRKNEGEEELMNMDLPEELLEIIISKLPFPNIFKARVLSSSWLAKLSAISAQDNEASRNLATYFHRLVGESSKDWRTFCAIWFYYWEKWCHPLQFHCFGHDRRSRRWRKLPSLSFLPCDVELDNFALQMEGALLYGSAWFEHNRHLLVANILTRTWKILPLSPDAFDFDHPIVKCTVRWQKLVSQTLPGELPGYKMITVGGYFLERRGDLECNHYSAHIYDSNSNSWITKKIISSEDVDRDLDFSTFAYVNGILYMMTTLTSYRPRGLLAFSIEEGTVKIYNLPNVNGISRILVGSPSLVACNTTLLLVLTDYETLRVFEVDLEPISGILLEVAQVTRAFLGQWEERAPISIDNCLYFLQDGSYRDRTIPMYDVEKDKWSLLTVPELLRDFYALWRTTCFQPGLNPFMPV